MRAGAENPPFAGILFPQASIEQVFIRGAGSTLNLGFEQSVGTFVDGAYRGRSRSIRTALFDIEQIEVLKGPQTTFSGNNTIAGAINITTKKPGEQSGYDLTTYTAVSTGELTAEGGVNIPIDDRLKMRVSGKLVLADGYITNTDLGYDGPRLRDYFGRMSVKWKVGSSVAVDARIDAGRMRDRGIMNTELERCPPDLDIFTITGSCLRYVSDVGESGVDNKNDYRSAAGPNLFNYDFVEAIQTSSIDVFGGKLILSTSIFNHKYDNLADAAPVPAKYRRDIGEGSGVPSRFIENFNQKSQEVRFDLNRGGGERYYIGGFFAQSDLEINSYIGYFFRRFGSDDQPLSIPVASSTYNFERSTSYSLFGALSYPVLPGVILDAGGRYTFVRKRVFRSADVGTASDNLDSGTFRVIPDWMSSLGPQIGLDAGNYDRPVHSDSSFQPYAALRLALGPSRMVYASYAKGFKGGGFSTFTSKAEFEAERADSFEVGFKTTTEDRRGFLAVAAFASSYRNLQGATTLALPSGAIVNRVGNIGASTSRGIDFNAGFDIAEGLTASTAVTYLHSRYSRYPNASCTIVQLAEIPAGCTQNLAGRLTAWAPAITGNVMLDYRHQLKNGLVLNVGGTAYFSTAYYLTSALDPYLSQGSFAKLDVRIAIGPSDERWSVAIIGRNLTNAYTGNYRSPYAGSLGTTQVLPHPPRSVGVQLSVRR